MVRLHSQHLEQDGSCDDAGWKAFIIPIIRPDRYSKVQRQSCQRDIVLVSVREQTTRFRNLVSVFTFWVNDDR